MRSIIAGWLLLALPMLGLSQAKSIESFYDKYMKYDNVKNVDLSGGILKLFSSSKDEEGEQGDLLSRITHLRVMIMENGNLVENGDYKKLIRNMKKEAFESLLQVRDEGTHVDLYIREEGEHISNAVLMVHEEDGFVLLSLEGLMYLKELQQLDIDVEGFEHFKKVTHKKLKKA